MNSITVNMTCLRSKKCPSLCLLVMWPLPARHRTLKWVASLGWISPGGNRAAKNFVLTPPLHAAGAAAQCCAPLPCRVQKNPDFLLLRDALKAATQSWTESRSTHRASLPACTNPFRASLAGVEPHAVWLKEEMRAMFPDGWWMAKPRAGTASSLAS